jgi:acyl-CoA synthetase (AMP-forming)/AMP-acid ligase II
LAHANINETVVFGIEDEVCAWVKLKSVDQETSVKEILEHCQARLADYQVPKRIRFVQEFPTIHGVAKYRRTEMIKIEKSSPSQF